MEDRALQFLPDQPGKHVTRMSCAARPLLTGPIVQRDAAEQIRLINSAHRPTVVST